MARAKKETPAPEKKQKKASALSIAMFDTAGKVVRDVELPKEIFNIEGNASILSQYVRVYRANQRQGNASTKTRSEVIGTTKKIYRQKGTGRARHGAKKAPIFVGGGVTFGPQPRDFSMKLNKKQKRKALFYSLTLKAKDKALTGLVRESSAMQPKTKVVFNVLKAMGADKKKILIVLPEAGHAVQMAARNLPNVHTVHAAQVNPYMVLNNDTVIFTEDGLENFVKHFMKAE
jgi:large subunit ribosomal protein L4